MATVQALKNQVEEIEKQQGYETWFACDECYTAIDPLRYRFDCLVCKDFTFCEKCYRRNTKHTHKFKRTKVPKDNMPPPNWQDLVA